ncbi:DNA mismatch repair endonuclease MutL [Caviibacter abscessus]|uniref:DNA mismatch repair endonuclease MutL n=1 Tax=Caviibacter abscessus TaxID=1766719 RepID=UPI000837BDF3|nr:DNA mismatch repair endonuclease MutL [Caviibacter abscessus]
MGKIKILDENVSNIIAAGEVVENPASMIKELLENSLDAGANNIYISVEDGGKYVKIVDDGVGMEITDLYLSIERHATSKLRTKEDIFNLSTFGFRGEALASICAVSKFTMTSKTSDMKLGHRIMVIGGNIVKSDDVASKTGTVIEIRDLFYNTPARKKFLKKEQTENSNIKDIVMKIALANYNVSIKLEIDGKQSISTNGNGIDNTLFELFGKNIFKNLKKFKYGYLGNSEIFRGSKNYIYTYVNNRYCKSNLIERAVIDGYYTKLMKNKYPFAIIFYNINSSEVDVNVHPSKKIVKFSDDKIVYRVIKSAIEDFFYEDDRKTWTPTTYTNKEIEIKKEIHYVNDEDKKTTYIQSIFDVNEENNVSNFEIIAQVFNTYIMVKNEDSIDFYDQHAMHERIRYEKLKEEYANKKMTSKQLLIPEVIEFTSYDVNTVVNNLEIFKEFGFDIEQISETEIILREVPDFELRNTPKNIIKAMIDSISEDGEIKDIREKIIVSMSCRTAIMAGQKLKMEEMQALVEELHKINKFNCPHGRPVISQIKKEYLDKLSKRKV